MGHFPGPRNNIWRRKNTWAGLHWSWSGAPARAGAGPWALPAGVSHHARGWQREWSFARIPGGGLWRLDWVEGAQSPNTQLVAGVSGDPRNQWLLGAHPEDKGLLWASPSKEQSPRCQQWLFGASGPQIYPLEGIPAASKPGVPLPGFQGGTVSEDSGLHTTPTVLGGESQPTDTRPTPPFGKVCERIEEGNGTLCGLLQWCCPGGCHILGEVPRRMNPGTHPRGDPGGPHRRGHWGASPCRSVYEGGNPHRGTHWGASPCRNIYGRGHPHRRAPTVASTEEAGPTEDPDEEPAASTATASWQTEEPDVPPVQPEEKEKGELPHNDFPGWTEVLHPSWTVIPTGQAPMTLGKLRLWCHSQSVGGRRAQHQRVEECRQATREKSDFTSSLESLEPISKVALPQALRGLQPACWGICPLWLPLRLPQNQSSQIHWWDPWWQQCILPK